MNATHTDRLDKLLDGCRRGDRNAQYEIYKLYSKAMYNTAWRILNQEAEAEDVLQESFLEALTGLHNFRGESTFGAWLKRIVVNKSLNALKRRKWTPTEMEELENLAGGEPAPPFPDEIPLSMPEIIKAVEQLPDGYRIVFTMYLIEGYDHEEIAGILGISVSGSKSQLNRAKLKLQKILTDKNYVRQF
jgi:RNA polymerase sigma factor (sigma-70 family)